MDLHLDTSWCPVCDKQIVPKRYVVPVLPPAPPAPPPSSPTSPTKTTSQDAPTGRRPKNGAARPRPGGLVHGTGRVKPNGTLKQPASQPVVAPVPVAPVKLRTVIDQGPIPLYCSDECQMADIIRCNGGYSHDYDPHRSPPPTTSEPHNSFVASNSASESESEYSGSSVDSYATKSPSIAVLAAMYNFPPLPPPPPIFDEPSPSSLENPNNYQSGIIMAGRRVKEALCPERPKRSAFAAYQPPPSEPRKPIPGWTDGSHAWRSSVYNFSAPMDLSNADPTSREAATKAYRSFVASPHRSRGVTSTLSDVNRVTALAGHTAKYSSETEELYSKYSECLSRRSESRASMFPSTSPTSPRSPARRERSLVMPGAEGKLLVPDVKLRVRGGSSSSLSSAWEGSSDPGSSRRSSTPRSPLGDNVGTSYPGPKRPVVETRSWSYDNVKTYPFMHLPMKEKRIEKQVVDGKEVEVEIEVEVPKQIKRLFLFPGKETRIQSR